MIFAHANLYRLSPTDIIVIYLFQCFRWSRGSLLAFSTRVQTRPKTSDFLRAKKILSTPSFGVEVKPSVPCRRFAACKRSLNGVEVVISAKLPDNILAHSSHFRCWGSLTSWRTWRHLVVKSGNV